MKIAASTINPLLECANTIFQLSFSLIEPMLNPPDLNFYEKMLGAFTQFEQNAVSRGISLNEIQQSKYALCAFVDEMVLTSNWEGRQAWLLKTLQLEFFGEHLAGEVFFKYLNELRQQVYKNIHILELYYVCLQLGFTGIYRLRGLESLLALQTDLRQQLTMVRGITLPQLADAAVPRLSLAGRVGQRIPLWVICLVTIAILFFIYLGFAIAMDHSADQIIENLANLRTQLLQELS